MSNECSGSMPQKEARQRVCWILPATMRAIFGNCYALRHRWGGIGCPLWVSSSRPLLYHLGGWSRPKAVVQIVHCSDSLAPYSSSARVNISPYATVMIATKRAKRGNVMSPQRKSMEETAISNDQSQVCADEPNSDISILAAVFQTMSLPAK
jgi:hypothetical protein